MAPPLQQFSMSQQASEFWLVFCGELRVKAAAETVRAAPHARAITSALNFFISISPSREIAVRKSFAKWLSDQLREL
jgi:hypothetical protein